MLEAVTWSFIPEAHAKAFGGGTPELKLANPISADMSDMRPSLLPGLLVAAQRNADYGIGDVALFEVSHLYEGDRPEDQKRVASGIRRGTARPERFGPLLDRQCNGLSVCSTPRPMRLQCWKPAAWMLPKSRSRRAVLTGIIPDARARFKLGPKITLGTFGEFHPMTLETLDVSGALCGFEIYLDAIPEAKRKATRTKPPLALSSFQAVKRDFAFVLDKEQDAATLLRAASGADKKLITNVSVFDVVRRRHPLAKAENRLPLK